MTSSLQQRVWGGLWWSAIDVILRQGMQFIVLLVLARLLSPEEFGVIALLAVFVGLANAFIDSGFGAALIQRQQTTHVDESTVFYFNVAMGLATALLLCLGAPFIAAFYNKPAVQFLTYAMALNVLIGAFGAIHMTLLIKALNLKLLAKIGGIASALSGVLAIYLANTGFGAWSLAAQMIAASLISTLLLWLLHGWRPLWTFSMASLRSFFRFGGYLMIVAIADILHTNLYSLLIGKLYRVRDVGFYGHAQKTQQLPVNFVIQVVNRIAFSAFATIADDTERLARAFRRAQRVVMFVNLPLTMLMIVLAEQIIATLFGDKWLPSAPILQILSISGMVWPLHVLNINVLKAQGRSDLFFRTMLLKKTVAIGLTVAGSFHGILAIAWAQVAASLFSILVNTYYSKMLLNYGARKQLADLLPSLLLSLTMGGVLWYTAQTWQFSQGLELAFGIALGGLTYLTSAYLFRLHALAEITGMMLKKPASNLS